MRHRRLIDLYARFMMTNLLILTAKTFLAWSFSFLLTFLKNLQGFILFKRINLLNLIYLKVEGQNVRNVPHPVRIRWSRQPNLAPFYLYNRIFECPETMDFRTFVGPLDFFLTSKFGSWEMEALKICKIQNVEAQK